MNVVTAIVLGLLTVAAALCFARAIRPGTDHRPGDRARRRRLGDHLRRRRRRRADRTAGVLVDIALVGGLLGFLTLSTVARYVGRRGL